MDQSQSVFDKKKQEIIHKFLKHVGQIPAPKCWHCWKMVEAMSVDLDPVHDDILLVIQCHGDKSYLRIPVSKIDYIGEIEIGFAFRPEDSTGNRQDGIIQGSLVH